ncbi:FxsA family protein [Desulfoplanes formicivorans]|uniref:Exclusion suppressor FxsA n=1 Tax=Desulfoplanes formicivorans TaxID=1592317 RepID=A0A194AHA6_9BACT|nr:FxsA family protein [Desulfoplanes formicivorans]GAU08713.1 exclusion suppressor FxsA [Desulfoplanes formicivorans]
MFTKLFIAFAVLPVLEIYVLIHVGSLIGALNTVMLVIISAFAGAWLARTEGMQTMLRIRESMNRGIMPTNDLVDAAIILVAGLVLLTPGFITDTLGLLLLFPPTRKIFKDWLMRALKDWMNNHPPTITYYGP